MKLKNTIKNIFIIFLFSFNSSFSLQASLKVNNHNPKKLEDNSLSIDYLRNYPIEKYILGPGDRLEIIISRDYPELTSSSTIDGQGTIYLPKLNRVFVEGLTISELNT